MNIQNKNKNTELDVKPVQGAELPIFESIYTPDIKPKEQKIGFILEKNELFFYKKDDSTGKIKAIPVSSRIEIIAKQSDLYSGGNAGLTLRFINMFEREIKWSIPRSSLADDRKIITELCGLGASVYDKPLFNNYLMTANPISDFSCVDSIGWHRYEGRKFFVLPHVTSGNHTDKDKLVYQSNLLSTLFKSKGTTEEWRDHVGKYCGGNSRLIFAVSHGLASMLLEPTGSTNGGINLFGSSSIGKTTIARVCASLFSDPSYLLSCRTTDNALEKTAQSHNDCFLILDEAAQMNPKTMGETAYMLGNGAAKERMKSGGELQEVMKFRLNFMLTGEIPTSQHIQEDKGQRATEGQSIRILDIPAGSNHGVFDTLHGFKTGAEFSKFLVEQSGKYYGTTFLQFIDSMLSIEDLREKLKETKERLINALPEDLRTMEGQADRALDRFTIAAYAGELATQFGLTGWDDGEAVWAAGVCFEAWVITRGGADNQEEKKLLQQVRDFIETHGESRFTDITQSNNNDSKTINRAGFRELKEGEWIYYVLAVGFKEMHKGFTNVMAIKSLVEAGWLQKTRNSLGCNIASKMKKSAKHGSHRVYELNLSMR